MEKPNWFKNAGKGIMNLGRKGSPQVSGAPPQPQSAEQSYSDLRNFISRLDWSTIRADVQTIMSAKDEADKWMPHRVKLQKIFDRAVLNDQVWACMERRRDLTLLRKYELYDPATNEPDKFWSDYIQAACFKLLNSYALDAVFYGYNLIALGDIVNGLFPTLGIVDRRKVNPDSTYVSVREYGAAGLDFTNEEIAPWHIWCTTPTENGRSNTGYGLLLRIALLEVLARANRTRNIDYNEVFGAPFRTGYTDKSDEGERQAFFEMMVKMGHLGAALLDNTEGEKIEFHETNTGTGYQTYSNTEERLYKGIVKLTLGHADALDSTPGKLGAGQGDDNPVTIALRSKQTKDGADIESLWNDQVLIKLRELGIKIPQHLKYRFLNDEEKAATRTRKDDSNKKTAEVYKIIKDAGGQPDWEQFTEETGIKVEKALPPPQLTPPGTQPPKETEEDTDEELVKRRTGSKELTASMRSALNRIYKQHQH